MKAGNIRAYAVTSNTRSTSAPELPTVDEAGAPGLHIEIWHGFWAPKGTPPHVIVKLNAALQDALADPAVRQRFAAMGQDIPALDQQKPEALVNLQKTEIARWWPIIKTAGIRVE